MVGPGTGHPRLRHRFGHGGMTALDGLTRGSAGRAGPAFPAPLAGDPARPPSAQPSLPPVLRAAARRGGSSRARGRGSVAARLEKIGGGATGSAKRPSTWRVTPSRACRPARWDAGSTRTRSSSPRLSPRAALTSYACGSAKRIESWPGVARRGNLAAGDEVSPCRPRPPRPDRRPPDSRTWCWTSWPIWSWSGAFRATP